MKRLLFIYAIILVSFSACRKDSLEIEDLGNSNNQEEFIEGNVSGLVLDQNGEPLSNVDISLEGKTTTTDENGYFKYSKLAASDEGSLLTFHKEGYFKSYKFTYTSLNTNSFVNVRMVAAEETFRFKSAEGGESEFQNGAKVNIPSNAIVKSDGDSYSGDVIVKAHWYSPSENETLETMPGDLRGINDEDEAVQLATYGMMAVELESPSGESLQLGNSQKAELTFPLSSEISSTAPNEIPLWHLDEETGIWIEEGSAKLTNGSYIGEVLHFSFWNCDAPFELVEIEGTLLNENGEVVTGYPVTIYVAGTNVSSYGYTNSNGVFKGKVPKDTPLAIRVYYCNAELLNESLGALSTDQNLGSFTVDFNDFAKQVKAKLVDCNNMPLVDAYAILRNGYYHTLLIPDSEGNVSGYVSGCGSPEINVFSSIHIQIKTKTL